MFGTAETTLLRFYSRLRANLISEIRIISTLTYYLFPKLEIFFLNFADVFLVKLSPLR